MNESNEARFHRKIAPLLGKRDQGRVMGAYREVHNLDLQHLRALRLWHWEQVLECSKTMQDPSRMSSCANDSEKCYLAARKLYAMHMQAVQALNDLFPIGDTAENDAAK